MKILKWLAAAACLLTLTACQSKPVPQPYTGPERGRQETAVQQELPALQADYTVSVDDTQLAGGVSFGGQILVPWQEAAQLWSLESTALLKVRLQERDMVCLEDLCRDLGYEYYVDERNKSVQVVTKLTPWQIPEGFDVPVLMYHGVSDDMWGMTELFVKPANMEEQIRYLVENGYTPIWFEDLPHVDKIEKPVILTFDDGYMDNYLELFPILQKYGVKATIFVVTATVDNNPRVLTSEQIREMSDSGLVSIQSHTVTHPYLNAQTREQQQWELTKSKQDIYAMTGKLPTVICYPSGRYDSATLELAQTYYQMGLKMNGYRYRTGENAYEVDRYYIRRQDGLGTFIGYIQ